MSIRKNKTFQKAVHNKSIMIGLIMVLIVILIAVFAPALTPFDLEEMDMGNALQVPGADHKFGTDQYGRDLMTRIFYGTRISLVVGFVSVFFSMMIGVFVGLLAGYYGGWVDNLIGRIIDVFLSFPVLLGIGENFFPSAPIAPNVTIQVLLMRQPPPPAMPPTKC